MDTIDFLRQFRFAGYAVFDLTLTFLGMALLASPLSWFFGKFGIRIPKKNWLFLALPIGILVHVLVGRYTPMTMQFFAFNGNNHWLLKLVIIALTLLGLRGITFKRS